MAEPIKKLTTITPPLALKDSGDVDRFNEAAESNLKDMKALADDLNDDFIEKVNVIIGEMNPLIVNSESIVAVGQNIGKVNTVAGSIAAVNTAAANIDAIKAAPAAATAAASSATSAGQSATAAAQSAVSAAEAAANAATDFTQAVASSVEAAAESASNAATSATAAEAAKEASEEIKHEVEQIQSGLLEGATSDPTPGTPVLRDPYGRTKFEAPVDAKDAATRKWVEDEINSALENFSSGLKIPVSINLESELPDIASAEAGDFYSIEKMDITAPGQQGRAWFAPDASTSEWQKIVDQVQSPDGVYIVLDADSKLNLSDNVQQTLGKVGVNETSISGLAERVADLEAASGGGGTVGGIEWLAFLPDQDDERFLKADGAAYPVSAYPELYAKIGRAFTPPSAGETMFHVPRVPGKIDTAGFALVPPVNSVPLAGGSPVNLDITRQSASDYVQLEDGSFITRVIPWFTSTSNAYFIKWHINDEGHVIVDWMTSITNTLDYGPGLWRHPLGGENSFYGYASLSPLRRFIINLSTGTVNTGSTGGTATLPSNITQPTLITLNPGDPFLLCLASTIQAKKTNWGTSGMTQVSVNIAHFNPSIPSKNVSAGLGVELAPGIAYLAVMTQGDAPNYYGFIIKVDFLGNIIESRTVSVDNLRNLAPAGLEAGAANLTVIPGNRVLLTAKATQASVSRDTTIAVGDIIHDAAGNIIDVAWPEQPDASLTPPRDSDVPTEGSPFYLAGMDARTGNVYLFPHDWTNLDPVVYPCGTDKELPAYIRAK